MADIFDQFLEGDEILASALEENLRHDNEIGKTPRSTSLDNHVPLDRAENNIRQPCSSNAVIDLCDSPKKCSTVQSRLSNYFTKHTSDIRKTNSEIQKQTENFDIDINSGSVHVDLDISSTPPIFHRGSDAKGFHLSSGSHYVYPDNYPVREYQMKIINTALYNNTLVSLPTGLGKTFIAAVVMYNFYRWYPMGKIVFMAPTRPLVTQQIEACHSIVGIPKDVTFEMTGNILPQQRYEAWKTYRVFFLTPQVLSNDLNSNKCPSEMLRCIIVDEAHRATKNYAYAQVLKRLQEENRIIRIVGLSATPGTTLEAVIEVVQNLNISKLEFRTDDSPDVVKYTNKKNIDCIQVKLSYAILTVRSQFLQIYDKYSRRLKQYRILNGNVTNLTKFQILGAKQKFVTSNLFREMPKPLIGCLINDFTICMSIAYTLELLVIYGIKVFYLQSLELLENHKCLSNDTDLKTIIQNISKELKSQDLTWSHPKLYELKNIVQDYFKNENTESNSKIIIFCQYRLVVVEIFELLKTFGSSVKPVMFVGQSMKEKGGLCQKKQLEVMRRFKNGDFNVLIATSVAEEGLDIGEVDLIICLEANKSPIKFLQRLGRTGRKRSGRCITLLTEGKEHLKYNSSISSSKTLINKILKNTALQSKLGPGGPRLVPKHLNPKLLMIHVKQPDSNSEHSSVDVSKNNALACTKRDCDGGENHISHRFLDEEKAFDACLQPCNRNDSMLTNCSFGGEQRGIRSVPKKNVLSWPERDCNGGENQDYYGFVEEEKLFDAWVKSCEQNDSPLMNCSFVKLLIGISECLPTVSVDEVQQSSRLTVDRDGIDLTHVERDSNLVCIDDVFTQKPHGDSDKTAVYEVDDVRQSSRLTVDRNGIDLTHVELDSDSDPVWVDDAFTQKPQSDSDKTTVDKVDDVQPSSRLTVDRDGIDLTHVERNSDLVCIDDVFTQKPHGDCDKTAVYKVDDVRQSSRLTVDRDVIDLTHFELDSDPVCVNDIFTQKPQQSVGDRTAVDDVQQSSRLAVDRDGIELDSDPVCVDDVLTQKPQSDDSDETVVGRVHYAQQSSRLTVDRDGIDLARVQRHNDTVCVDDVFTQIPQQSVGDRTAVDDRKSRLPVFAQPLDIIKACNLLKPGLSLKRKKTAATTAAAALFGRYQRQGDDNSPMTTADDDTSPIAPVRAGCRPSAASQSTPIVKHVPVGRRRTAAGKVGISLISSSSSSESDDVFVNDRDKETIRKRPVYKKRRTKKKLIFIDDEAEVTRTDLNVTSKQQDSSSSTEGDDNVDFDSSFIDDVEKCDQSTSMTKQYLQSVKSPLNVRGIFKIPKLSTQHYKIDVFSQMDDANDNSYVEDSFCVANDDLNTSSNESVHGTSEERPRRPQKRKRILSPQSSDSDSPKLFNRKLSLKRTKPSSFS